METTVDEMRDALDAVSHTLSGATPQDILRHACEAYPRVALACSFGGPTGMVLLHMVSELGLDFDTYYLDTGLLFAQTYALVDVIRKRYAIEPIAVRPSQSVQEQAKSHGDALWERDPDACCRLRKVEPQQAFLSRYDAWITGIRRDQAHTRSSAQPVAWDERFGLVKVCPLASWDERMVWSYVRAHDLPYNSLHDQGYASIGCGPCTRAIRSDETLRAGRWAGTGKIECGLHAAATLERGA